MQSKIQPVPLVFVTRKSLSIGQDKVFLTFVLLDYPLARKDCHTLKIRERRTVNWIRTQRKLSLSDVLNF